MNESEHIVQKMEINSPFLQQNVLTVYNFANNKFSAT